ncbi:uncharacterized protein LOC143208738 [Lasioglossum baleicum]|uniref:uncharacterized protein LOC143208738 n=1 Tax=Lasioglossum baleicum TaxID=434251 RepID=UPI003FCD625D
MQVHVKLLGIAVILVASIESKPIWPDVYLGNYASDAITLQQPQLLHYQQHNPYYYYNVATGLNNVPAAVIAHSKPTIPQISSYGVFYEHPFFDFRFPAIPLYPTVKPVQSDEEPKATPPTTTTTAAPTEEKDGGIEKLDNKVEPDKETKKSSEESSDDDTVVIESI